MTISKRIKKLCDFEGSQTKFGKKAGIDDSALSYIIKKDSKLRSDTLEAILLAYPNLNPIWLIAGKDPMWMDGENEGSESGVKETDLDSGEDQNKKEALKDEIIDLLKKRLKIIEAHIAEIDPDMAKRLGIIE